jgi:nitronate monooxygenase
MAAVLTDLLGIRQPVISAPMGMIAGGRLAAAVSRAGGLGLLGPGYLGADWIEREFRLAGGARVGVGFITWDLARSPDRLDAALAFRPAAVMLSFGDASPYVRAIRAAGARLLLQVQSVGAAQAAARLAPDVIIAQGTEAGGHGGGRSLFPLLPAVVDRVAPIPVVAAGGISDGRGIAAAFALGAAGVLIGTRFYAAEESLGLPAAKQRIVEGSGDATLRTRVFDIVRRLPWPPEFTGRALRNGFASRWHRSEPALTANLDQETPRYVQAVETGDFDTAAVWAGEGIDLVGDVAPAAAIMARLMAETHDALGRISGIHAGAPGGPG